MQNSRTLCVFLILMVVLSGCATSIKVPKAMELMPIRLEGTSKTIYVKDMRVAIPAGQLIGAEQGGTMCIPQHKLNYKLNISENELKKIVYDELNNARYKLVGDPSNIFEDEGSVVNDFMLAGQIKEIKTNLCYPNSGFFNYTKSRGETFISVEWQIYDSEDKKIVQRHQTQGWAEIIKPRVDGDKETVFQALVMATRNLLAIEDVHRLFSN